MVKALRIFLVIVAASFVFAGVLLLLTWPVEMPYPLPPPLEARAGTVTFISPTECIGSDGLPAQGTWRWAAKVDSERPAPDAKIWSEIQPVTISEMAAWPMPKGKFGKDTPRQGKELEWFEVTGTVVLVKCEDDGDLHVQIQDGDSPQMVVEIPLGNRWSGIREQIFGWSDTTFPCKPHVLKLNRHPRAKFVGKAFFDLFHQGDVPGRRSYEPGTLIVEIHPVMRLKEL